MDLNAPNSEPNTEKAEKDEIASKPDDTPKKNKTDYKDKKIEGSRQKPRDKPKNKIEPRKLDIQKEPRHKIQRQKSNPLTPPRNKIERPTFDPGREPINKIEPRQFKPGKPRNKIKPRKIDIQKEPNHKIQCPQVKPGKLRNKIELHVFKPEKELFDNLRQIYSSMLGKQISNTKLGKNIGYNNINITLNDSRKLKRNSIKNIKTAIRNDIFLSEKGKQTALKAINMFKEVRGYTDQNIDRSAPERELFESLRNNLAEKLGKRVEDVSYKELEQHIGKTGITGTLRNHYRLTQHSINKIERTIRNDRELSEMDNKTALKAINKFKEVRGYTDQNIDRNAPERELFENLRNVLAEKLGKRAEEVSNKELGLNIGYKEISPSLNNNSKLRLNSINIIEEKIREGRELSEKGKETALKAINKFKEVRGYTDRNNIRNAPERELFESLRNVLAEKLGKRVEDVSYREVGQNIGYIQISDTLRIGNQVIRNSLQNLEKSIKNNNAFDELGRDQALKAIKHYRSVRYIYDFNENGEPLTHKEKVGKLAESLKECINSKEFKEKHDFKEGIAPPYNLIKKEIYNAMQYNDIRYSEITRKAGLALHELSISHEVGDNIHWLNKRIFMQHTREIGCSSFYEPFTNIKTERSSFNDFYEKYGLKHCDNTIHINEKFKELSFETKQLYENQLLRNENDRIKIINIDYYLGNSETYTIDHCLRGYQGRNKMLMLMPTHANSPRPIPENIPFRKNVKILDPVSFANFFGYKGKIREDFFDCISLAKSATHIPKLKDRLDLIADKNKEILRNNYNYGHKKLEEYIKNPKSDLIMDILKYQPDKSSLEYYINTFKNEEKKGKNNSS
ncbi:MAG: hypothetical protein CEE42_10800 [Promethearchaeota archaeon Loki_b31]|nr:MAG: hypothetical protein CEE42_10800 [Candidatus Lokiarchaeota archaeon Loki_b31]